jgi:hypothetical protein
MVASDQSVAPLAISASRFFCAARGGSCGPTWAREPLVFELRALDQTAATLLA